jgi:hypothetical protein
VLVLPCKLNSGALDIDIGGGFENLDGGFASLDFMNFATTFAVVGTEMLPRRTVYGRTLECNFPFQDITLSFPRKGKRF